MIVLLHKSKESLLDDAYTHLESVGMIQFKDQLAHTLSGGQIVEIQSGKNLFENPQKPRTKAFLKRFIYAS